MKTMFFSIMMTSALALSACASPTSVSPTQISDSDQLATVVAATMQAFPSNTPEPACPDAVEGTKLLIREAVGYCLLYPEGYIEIETVPTTVCLVPDGPTMGCHNTNLIIEVEDAGGRTVGEIADEIVADTQTEIPGIQIRRTNLSIAGEEAVVLEGLPGVASSRHVLLVHEDRRYELIFVPWDETDENFAKLGLLYNTVVNSLTLHPIGQVTLQALPTFTPKPPPTACKAPTFKASDAASDCFNSSGERIPCAGLDLVAVEAGVVAPFDPSKAIPAGFILTFAEPLDAAQEFTLYLFLDLDENPDTGLDMSAAGSVLPGIDRLFGITLPSGDAWTQVVAKGIDAEIIRGPEQASVTRLGSVVTVMVGRGLLEDKSAKAAGPSLNLPVGGAFPDAFAMYIATGRGETVLDFFDNGQEIQLPQSMTVPKEALYSICGGGGS
jgi:hypothetical protein